MSCVINLDLGPSILGYPTQIAGNEVCVLSPRAADDRTIQASVRRFMKGQGRNCRTCRGCPVGTAE